MGLTRDQVKAERKRLGIGTTALAKMAFNNGLGDKRTIEIYNSYAKKIFTEAYGDDPELMAIGRRYIAELPKAARKGQEREFIAGCEAKLEAFRGAVRDYNLSINQGIIDNNAQKRYDDGELAADARAANTDLHVTQEANRINTHTDESNAQQTMNINNNTNRKINSAVRIINVHTTAEVNRGVSEVNAHTTAEVNRGVKEVNAHTTAEHTETRRQGQQQAVLNAKRQTLSDMLMNEVNENIPGNGQYRDITVKWLGSAADRVMAGTDLTFEEKKAALDELVKMVDEENVISDGDKAAFEAKYFYRTQERPHL